MKWNNATALRKAKTLSTFSLPANLSDDISGSQAQPCSTICAKPNYWAHSTQHGPEKLYSLLKTSLPLFLPNCLIWTLMSGTQTIKIFNFSLEDIDSNGPVKSRGWNWCFNRNFTLLLTLTADPAVTARITLLVMHKTQSSATFGLKTPRLGSWLTFACDATHDFLPS